MDAIRIAQTVGITSAAFCAGMCFPVLDHSSLTDHVGGTLCISYYHVPSLLLAPYPLVAHQWRHSFDTGKIAHPALALVSSVAFGYVAYQWQGTLRQPEAELYGVAIVLNLLMWPWTIIFTLPTNNKLFRKCEETEKIKATEEVSEDGVPKEETARELVSKWGKLNYVRGCMPLAAALLGTYISLA